MILFYYKCRVFFYPFKNFSLTWRRHNDRWKAANFDLHICLGPLSSEGSLQATPTVTQNIRIRWSSPRTRDTHTYCRAFGSGVFTTFFNDLGLSRLGFENSTIRLRGECSNRLRHRRGFEIRSCKAAFDIYCISYCQILAIGRKVCSTYK